MTVSGAGDRRRLPGWVQYFNALARPLLAIGVPLGPDGLLTVRDRRSGVARTTPITICEYGGRRGFISPFGESNWVRNLRVAGTAVGRRREDIRAVELNEDEAARFIREVVLPVAAQSKVGDWFVRNIDKVDLDHPEAAVIGMPVFEVFPVAPVDPGD